MADLIPVKVGEEYEVDITETGHMGFGIAKIEEFIIFVPHTKVGEKVKIKITKVKDASAYGEVVKWIKKVDTQDLSFTEEPKDETEFFPEKKDAFSEVM